MKSTSKMMVVAVVFLVAAAMLVMPAAARNIDTTNNTIFDYEKDLDLSAFAGTADDLKLQKFTDDQTDKGVISTIPVGKTPFKLDLTEIDLNGNYGTYFVVINNTVKSPAQKVMVYEPTVKLDVVLESSPKDSIAGKTVTKSTPIRFQFDATQVGTYYPDATVKVELATPGGAKITQIKGVELVQTLDKSRTYIGNVDISGLEAGTYTAQAVWESPVGFKDYAKDSNTASFTISSKDISIESNKESVVRNNPFVVTVNGDSKSYYYVYIKNAGVDPNEYPFIKAGQPSVSKPSADMMANTTVTKEWANVSGVAKNGITAAYVQTDAGGKRAIEFGTNTTTSDKTYTIKVVDPTDNSKYDEVKVKIEKGEVTLTAEGAGTYYLGEEIKLSGTNTDSEKVYLFMVGPNLGDQNGVPLNNIDVKTSDAAKYTVSERYISRDVESDDTWEYRWDTSAIKGTILDAGTYTIYAVSDSEDADGDAVHKGNLNDVKYATFSVTLKKGFVTAQASGTTLAKGDEFKVTGTAEGKPSNVFIWVFGKNYRDTFGDAESVEDDGSFEYTLSRGTTQNLATGQYFAIVQHPMTDGVQNVKPATADEIANSKLQNPSSYVIKNADGSFIDLGKLAASDAATALVDALNSPNSDDTYAKLSFMVEEAWIRIDSIGDKAIGEKFTITGTTNLAVGDELNVDVTSASFKPTEKTQAEAFFGSSGTVKVVEGTDYNKWSFEVDATNYKADQYTVKVESVDADVTQSATFNVVEGVTPTPTQPAGNVTTVQPTQTATTTAPATTPTQPGFGALISLIGLGAVAFLVMRRN